MTLNSTMSTTPYHSSTAPLTKDKTSNTTSEVSASSPLAKFIDLSKWEHNNDNHYHWEGQINLQELPRIYALRDENYDDTQAINIKLDIQKKGEIFFWQLQTNGVLWQTCQRCLEPVATSLDINSELALIENESHVALLDEDTEVILIDELTDDNKLWLLPMIEDELLVNLPLAPKHEDCEMAVSQFGELPEVTEDKENPFAILAGLKS